MPSLFAEAAEAEYHKDPAAFTEDIAFAQHLIDTRFACFAEADEEFVDKEAGVHRRRRNKPGKNWIEKTTTGHLPEMVRRIADHLMVKGFDESHAIAVAVNAVKKMCRGRLNWQPKGPPPGAKARARACKSFAHWELKKAQARAKRG